MSAIELTCHHDGAGEDCCGAARWAGGGRGSPVGGLVEEEEEEEKEEEEEDEGEDRDCSCS